MSPASCQTAPPCARGVSAASRTGQRNARAAITRHGVAARLGLQVAPLAVARSTGTEPVYTRRIRVMGIRDHPVAARSPWQNAYVERLIGSIRRECLDHLVVLGDWHLHRILRTYASYYNEVRTHLSLDKDAPKFRRSQRFGRIVAMPILGGLHHQYVRI